MKTDRERVIALAGIFQAAHLAAQIANTGMADTEASQTSVDSLFKIDADSVEDVYGGVERLEIGLNLLYKQLGLKETDNVEVSRYVLTLLHLENKLQKHPEMLNTIHTGMQR